MWVSCRDCIFWGEDRYTTVPRTDGTKRCMRLAPRPGITQKAPGSGKYWLGYAIWPVTGPGEGCGEGVFRHGGKVVESFYYSRAVDMERENRALRQNLKKATTRKTVLNGKVRELRQRLKKKETP